MIIVGLDILYWLTFIVYLSGGLVIGDKHHLGAIQEVLRVIAVISMIAFFCGVDLTATKFARGWVNFGESIKKRHGPTTVEGRLVAGGCGVLILLFFLAPLVRHWSFGTWVWDLGTLMQIIWRGGHGYGFTFTVFGPPEAPPRDFLLHTHLSLWIIPVSWLFRIFPYAETLIFLQSLALVSCLVPLYLLAEKLFPKKISPLLLPVFYWCFETVHRINMWDVHENAFITVFALWALYFFTSKKYWLCGLFTLLVTIFKEDAWVLAGAMACFFLFSRGRRILAVLSLFVGFFVFVYYSAHAQQTLSVGGRYAFLGSNFEEAKTTVITRPWVFLVQLGWPSNFLFYIQMALVAGGLWLLGGWSLFMVAPVFFEVALSTFDGMKSPSNHYIYPMAGPLFFSAALGMQKLGKFLKPERLKETATVLLLICLMQLKYSESSNIQSMVHGESWKERHCLARLAETVPPEVPVYGRDPFFTRLATRPEIWSVSDFSKYSVRAWTVVPKDVSVPPNYEIVKEACGFQVLKGRNL